MSLAGSPIQHHSALLCQMLIALSPPVFRIQHRMMHSSAQELRKESWLAQASQQCIGSNSLLCVTLQKCLPSWGSTVLLPALTLLALPAAKWENAVLTSPTTTATGVVISDCLFAWLKPCTSANHAAPQGTSALPCVHVLTEGLPFEPKIYFRNEYGESSWTREQTWNIYLLYDY